jgi:hypothetical protein
MAFRPALIGTAAGFALAGMIVNPAIVVFLAVVAADQLVQLRRHGSVALGAARPGT